MILFDHLLRFLIFFSRSFELLLDPKWEIYLIFIYKRLQYRIQLN